MQQIREAVLTCLNQAENDKKLIQDLNSIAAQSGAETYRIILHVLTHLDLEPQAAEASWKEISVCTAK